MAPDRGPKSRPYDDDVNVADEAALSGESAEDSLHQERTRAEAQKVLADRASQPQNFTIRGVVVGLLIGIVICFSNIYFGLQTGWISGMAMPSALIGFGFFRAISSKLKMPFSPVENVLVQTVAGAVGTMPLGCGFVGVIPALEFLLTPEEGGPLHLGIGKLMVWAVGICLFGVVIGVPLRKQVIIREKLKFPTGSATALMIGVLHGEKQDATLVKQPDPPEGEDYNTGRRPTSDEAGGYDDNDQRQSYTSDAALLDNNSSGAAAYGKDWQGNIRILAFAFGGSAIYTVVTYFIPQIRNVPVFGFPLAREWLWTLNPSPAYVGQGIIMGPATTMHMLFGAILGWGILSPLAKYKGWAPGPVDDWESGSKGWIVWISLSIMLADAIVSLGWLILRPTINYSRHYGPTIYKHITNGEWRKLVEGMQPSPSDDGYTALNRGPSIPKHRNSNSISPHEDNIPASPPEVDAPPSHLISTRSFFLWLGISIILYFVAIHFSFPIPLGASTLALILALLLSIMGVRALGETDLNPVSGISKLTQLFFAAVITTAVNSNAIVINLLAGAISEAGALQAGDLMQDLKTGHLLGAAPNAQFYGQVIGSLLGAVVSAGVYRLYTNTYEIPGPLFQMPTAYVWLFTARLVTGTGLPPRVAVFALAFAVLWGLITALRTYFTVLRMRGVEDRIWWSWVPGGIAVAVGMYNTPSFTLARAIGGLVTWWWTKWRGKSETSVVVLASGLILGEGLFSIVNLGLQSAGVPHLAL